MKHVSIIGLGYIGLPTAILTAEAGYDVFGFDIDKEKVKKLNNGIPTINEPGIEERLDGALKKKNFKINTHLEYADFFIITVPTPFKKNKTADLQYVYQAIEAIAQKLMPGNLVIIESTIPVGTTEKLALYLEELSGLKLSSDFFVTYCPERSIPGKIFKELVENDRVLGGVCQRSCELAYLFYSKFVKGFLHITDDKTAETVKLIENSSRDVQIAFANQVAAMCTTIGIDPYTVIDLANKHPRVNILSPTCGVGGHCIAVDPWFLIENLPNDSKLLRVAREINDSKPHQIIQKILTKIQELKDLGQEKIKILTLGLSFKPDVDDIRESPALMITKELLKQESLEVIACDPYVDKNVMQNHGILLTTSLKKELASADIVVILVKHKEFLLLPEDTFCNKIVFDTCGLLHEIHKKHSKELWAGATRLNCGFENITF